MNCPDKFAVIVAFLILAIWGCSAMIEQSLSVKDDVNRYADYLAEMEPYLVAHFPKQIADKSNARVVFSPGALQSNMFLQLRLQLDAASIANIQELAQSKAIAQYNGGSMFDHYNDDQEDNFPTTGFRTDESDNENFGAFPAHYTLYVLSAKRPRMDWETTGIAISTENNSVIYWAEDD